MSKAARRSMAGMFILVGYVLIFLLSTAVVQATEGTTTFGSIW